MTSKAVISQLEVNERRLKGIYDQLECGNFKKAICEAEKVLKKNANLLPAKVLKGLALYRLKKDFEAYQLIDEVARSTPTDENTLNSLSYFYKESNQKTKIIDIYENAYRKCPNREDICANLFYCHIKNFDYPSQQKIAAQLKKINANHLEYVMWPIIANVLHGVYSQDQRLLKLGEATLIRYLRSGSLLTVAIVELFMYTLEKLDKLEDCIDWLTGDDLRDVIESKQNKLIFDRYKISIFIKLGRKREACDLLSEILQNNPEDICMWRDYIDVVINLNPEQKDLHSISSVINRLNLIDKQTMPIRVAKIHLSLKLEKLHLSEYSNDFGSKVSKILEYFTEYGDKPSCLFDIYFFLALDDFSIEDRQQILNKISEISGNLSIDNLTCNKDIERFVTIETLKRATGAISPTETSLLMSCYEHSLQFSENTSPSEIKPCDNFAKLAALHLYDNWINDKCDTESLVSAISILKDSIHQSPANYHLKLILARLFGVLGCQDLLIDQFHDLEIKQLMWDSLGHGFLLPILYHPSFEKRIQFFQKNIDRKDKNKLEIEDSLVTCYKLGNYSRIPEIIDFYRDIDLSCMSRMCEIEMLYANTVLNNNNREDLFECFSALNIPEIESAGADFDITKHYSNLKDFRDLKTSPDFCHFDKLWTAEDQKNSFDNILLWISHRHAIVQSFFLAAKFTMETVVKLDRIASDSSVSFESEPSMHYETLKSSYQQLKNIWNKLRDLSGSYKNLSLNATGCLEPPQEAFNHYYIDTISACIESMLTFHDTYVRRVSTASLTDWSVTFGTPTKSVVDLIITSDIENGNLFSLIPEILTKLTLVCELISMVTITLSLLENMSKPLRPQLAFKRRNKKKKSDQSNEIVSESKNESMKSFFNATNFHKLPEFFTNIIVSLNEFVSRSKVSIESTMKPKYPALSTIGDSWIKSLDDSLKIIHLKKVELDNLKKLFEEENQF